MASHEFSEEENTIILSLAKRMKAVSLLLGLTGLIAIGNAIPAVVSGSPAGIGGIIAGVFAIVQSIVFFRPTDNLANIVNTRGNDIGELMQGFRELATGLRLIVFLLGLIAGAVVTTVAISGP